MTIKANMINKIYLDIDTGVIGILSLYIDKEKREWHEKYFYQTNIYGKPELQIKIYGDIIDSSTMIVTFNGRAYDFGQRLKSFLEQTNIIVNDKFIDDLFNRDRDLIDICQKRGIDIRSDYKEKGKEKIMGKPWESGLFSTVDRLIGYYGNKENGGADRELEKKYRRAKDLFYITFIENPTLWKAGIKKEHTDKNTHKWKNEADVRALPLIEDALGLLYETRTDEDNYRHKW